MKEATLKLARWALGCSAVVAILVWSVSAPWIQAQTYPAHPEVCPVYVNTGDVVVATGTDTRYDAQAEVEITVPAGSTGIDSWQFGMEAEPGTRVRALIFLRSGGPLSHFATREAAQSQFIRPGAPIALPPGQPVILRARFFNEAGGVAQVARANVWVYFRMGETY